MPIVDAISDSRGRARPATALLVFVLLMAGCLALPSLARAASGSRTLDPEERAMCEQINAYRATKGLRALRVSIRLTRAADWMSRNMARHDYFDHDDSMGRSTSARIRSFGYRSAWTGENLAAGLSGAQATFGAWRSDEPHRVGMLGRKFKVIGIGRAYSRDSMMGWYWTTTFGARTDRSVAC